MSAAISQRRPGMSRRKGRNRFIFFCLFPAVVLFLIFMVYPTLSVFRMSLYKWGGFTSKKSFVGFNNFQLLIEDNNFLRSMQNTVLLIVLVSVFTLGMALVFAAILTREKLRGKSLYRIIFYIPNILSIVVVSNIFSAIYDPAQGLLNSILAIFRSPEAEPIYWLGNQKIIIFSVAVAMIWQAIGYYMVMYMASMSSVPESLYECADLEGATHPRQFFTITLPLIWTNLRTTLTFFIISTINLSFTIVKAMTDGGPNSSSEVFLSYMYKQAYTNSSYGYGMAICVVVFIFSFALSGILNGITRREHLEF